MPEVTISKLPELIIFGSLLPKSKFSAVSTAIFHANVITGNIWPRVYGQLGLRAKQRLGAMQMAGIQADGWKPGKVKT